jgi:hypothetical protein
MDRETGLWAAVAKRRVINFGLIRITTTLDTSIETAFISFILYQYKQKYPFLALDTVSFIANEAVQSS